MKNETTDGKPKRPRRSRPPEHPTEDWLQTLQEELERYATDEKPPENET